MIKTMLTKQLREMERQAQVIEEAKLQTLYAEIQKGYDELMERNKRTEEWMKSVGLIKEKNLEK